MKLLKLKNEFEAAGVAVKFQMAGTRFRRLSKTCLAIEEDEPALILPATFCRLLRDRLSSCGNELIGCRESGNRYEIITRTGTIVMNGVFSVNDIIERLS